MSKNASMCVPTSNSRTLTDKKPKMILYLTSWGKSITKYPWEQLLVWVKRKKALMHLLFDFLCVLPSGF